jgi:hypothetical protein
MTDKELLQEIQAEQELLLDARNRLQAEIDKPADMRDYDLIQELTAKITMLDGSEEWIQQRTEKGIRLVQAEIWHHFRKKRIRMVRILVSCACLLLCCNIGSYKVYGMDMFSAAYRLIKGSIVFDLTQQSDMPSETGNPYLEEMQQICAEHDMDILLPSYIPDGFEPNPEIFGQYHGHENDANIIFNFKKGKKIINLIAECYYDMKYYIPIGVASDEHHVSMQTINGTTVYIVKEDNQFSAVFLVGQTQYAMSTNGLDYDECQRVLNSFFT